MPLNEPQLHLMAKLKARFDFMTENRIKSRSFLLRELYGPNVEHCHVYVECVEANWFQLTKAFRSKETQLLP